MFDQHNGTRQGLRVGSNPAKGERLLMRRKSEGFTKLPDNSLYKLRFLHIYNKTTHYTTGNNITTVLSRQSYDGSFRSGFA